MLVNLIISTIAFFVATSYFKKYLAEMDLPEGMTRGILIFTLATAVALCTGALVNWVEHRLLEQPTETIPMLHKNHQPNP